MRFLVLTFLLLAGCGTESSKNASTAPKGQNGPTAATEQQTNTPAPPDASTQQEAIYAVSLANVAELPECSKANAKQLAYVRQDSKFYSCEPSGWQPLDVVGAKGDKGDKGDAGAAGADGKPAPSNEWVDAVDKHVYLIGQTSNFSDALAACTGDFRLPTLVEAHNVALHGLGNTLTAARIWASDTNTDPASAYAEDLSSGVIVSLPKTENHPIVCIQKS